MSCAGHFRRLKWKRPCRGEDDEMPTPFVRHFRTPCPTRRFLPFSLHTHAHTHAHTRAHTHTHASRQHFITCSTAPRRPWHPSPKSLLAQPVVEGRTDHVANCVKCPPFCDGQHGAPCGAAFPSPCSVARRGAAGQPTHTRLPARPHRAPTRPALGQHCAQHEQLQAHVRDVPCRCARHQRVAC